MNTPVLSLQDVSVAFARRDHSSPWRRSSVLAVDRVSLEVRRGECVGLVGESGSGKSTLGLVAAGLVPPTTGSSLLNGEALSPTAARRSARHRRALQIVLQDPHDALDPTMTVAASVSEGLEIHRLGGRENRRDRVVQALAELGLDRRFLRRLPHQLSGGQRQRVAIARALVVGPEVLVLDEPTSALDLSVQAQILNVLLQVQQRRNLSCLLISHDIDVIRHLCHRIYVMRAGRIVEHGESAQVLSSPRDDYTRRLLDSVPKVPDSCRLLASSYPEPS